MLLTWEGDHGMKAGSEGVHVVNVVVVVVCAWEVREVPWEDGGCLTGSVVLEYVECIAHCLCDVADVVWGSSLARR